MKPTNTDVLISGASIAGPTLAWWLCRSGFTATVVEQTPALRAGLGGHAVDLLGRSVDVAEWMGILPEVLAARTRTERISIERPGKSSVQVDVSRLVAGISDSGGCCGRRSRSGPGSCRACSRSWSGPRTSTSTRSARSAWRAGRAGG